MSSGACGEAKRGDGGSDKRGLFLRVMIRLEAKREYCMKTSEM